MANKGIAVFTNNGEDFNINDPNVADEYSASGLYAYNEQAYHAGKLNRCIIPITAGESWNASKWEEIREGKIVSDLYTGIQDFGFVETVFEQTGSHSTGNNQLRMPLAAGESFILDVRCENGDALTGQLSTFYGTGSTAQGSYQFTTGTVRLCRTSPYVDRFGIYLPAVSSATKVTFRIAKMYCPFYQGDILDSMFGIRQNRFVMYNTASHGQAADKIYMNVSSGAKIDVLIKLEPSQAISGAVIGYKNGTSKWEYGITTGTKRTITLTDAIDSIGFYLPAPASDCNGTFTVIRHTSIIYDGDGGSTDYDALKPSADQAITKFRNLQTYENGVAFAFITDMHWETNWQTSPEVMDYIAGKTRLDLVINGGDLASGDGGNGSTQKAWLDACTSAFHGKYRYYAVNGNHDNNSVGGTAISAAEIKNLILPNPADVEYGSGNYYTFSYGNTRFICLDTGTDGNADATQITWAKNVIEAAEEDYIIFIMHIVYVSSSASDPCQLFQDLITMIGTLSAADKAKIQAMFAGHQHYDLNFTFSGIPVVLVDTDSRFADDGVTRVQGTSTAQLFDLITVNYDTKKINCTRVGTIGSDREISY